MTPAPIDVERARGKGKGKVPAVFSAPRIRTLLASLLVALLWDELWNFWLLFGILSLGSFFPPLFPFVPILMLVLDG
ncbi:hypothetical protein BDQ17DRAFT_1367127 [Cyathus striatus]|nr:hypothetical protein BDQ17DRAFT_1367127 [Cyathus striatus]